MATKIPSDMFPGTVHHSNNCGDFEIVEYVSSNDVVIRFIQTGYEKSTRTQNIRTGKVKDVLFMSVFGVGFVGIGKYTKTKNLAIYNRWAHMLERCYDEKCLVKHPTYRGCTVCDEWHNFQNFADWHENNHPKHDSSYALDKDIKVMGNKIYSPNACLFVSDVVNSFLVDNNSARGNYMVGSSLEDGRLRFRAECNNPISGAKEYLGRYPSEQQAHQAWRNRKSELAVELAIKQDNPEVRDGLLRYAKALDNYEIYKDGRTKWQN